VLLGQAETHLRFDMSCHSVVKHCGTQTRLEEVEAKVNGFDVHLDTQLLVVKSAKYGSGHMLEHDEFFGFKNNPTSHEATQVNVAVFIT
jgi:hypothetical protein